MVYTFPGHPISDEMEVAVRIPVARSLILNPSSDQVNLSSEHGVNTDLDTATGCYRDDGHTHSQSIPLRKL